MQLAPALPPLHSRALAPRYTAEAVQIAGDGPNPVVVTRGSRAQVSFNGQIVAAGGYPAPIRRTPSFAVIPHAGPPPYQQPVVNVVTGVKAVPNHRRSRKR